MNLDRTMERKGGAKRRPVETGARRRFLASLVAALGLLLGGLTRRRERGAEGDLSLHEAEFYRPQERHAKSS